MHAELVTYNDPIYVLMVTKISHGSATDWLQYPYEEHQQW